MSDRFDVVVIGAGPGGLAASIEAQAMGLRCAVIDERPEPGGQIYRAVESVTRDRRHDLALLGADYAAGAGLARAFRAAGADYLPSTSVWQVDPDGRVHCTDGTAAFVLKARNILIATGAMERPVPVPGWTLPGVMTVGAAQLAMKADGIRPDGPTVIAGNGPLMFLAAAQLLAAGANITAVLDTTRLADHVRALPYLPKALLAPGYLRKGLAWRRRIRNAVPLMASGLKSFSILGEDHAAGVAFEWNGARRSVLADNVLVHAGVVPNTQITRQAGCEHAWSAVQRCWRPVADQWGATSVEGIHVAGDSAGIRGAQVAEADGHLAILDIVCRQDRISNRERDRRARRWRRIRFHHMAVRPWLDRLFMPRDNIAAPDQGETIVCRCEEITVDAVRDAVATGCLGPNQLKSYTRCGMGPCQGRLCGLTASEVIARARGVDVPAVGYYRVRPPIKPLTLAELAAATDDEPAATA